MKTPPMSMPPQVGRIEIRLYSTVHPGFTSSPDLSFGQCTKCKAVYQIASRGRLPKCPDCAGRLERVKFAI